MMILKMKENLQINNLQNNREIAVFNERGLSAEN